MLEPYSHQLLFHVLLHYVHVSPLLNVIFHTTNDNPNYNSYLFIMVGVSNQNLDRYYKGAENVGKLSLVNVQIWIVRRFVQVCKEDKGKREM